MNANDLNIAQRIPFRYGISSGVLVGSATANKTLTLDQSTQFEWHSVEGTSDADVETNVKENNFTVLLSQTNGVGFSTLPIHQQCLCPQVGGWKFKLPIILPGGYQISAAFVDLGAGGTHKIELVGFCLRS
jgi:hypothetical protein